MNNNFSKSESKRSIFAPSLPSKPSSTGHRILMPSQNSDPLISAKKAFHSPVPSMMSGKITDFEEKRKLSIQYDRLFSPNSGLLPLSTNSREISQTRVNFFVPDLKNSDSKFFQKIRNTYEKKFQLVNEAEVKRFNTSGYEDSFQSHFNSRTLENAMRTGFVNFVEINTSKGDDRSGLFFL